MAAVLGRLAAAIGLAAAVAVPRASAQFGNDPVTEEEATVFLEIFTGELRNCEQDAVVAHFLPGVNVYVVHADGRQGARSRGSRAPRCRTADDHRLTHGWLAGINLDCPWASC